MGIFGCNLKNLLRNFKSTTLAFHRIKNFMQNEELQTSAKNAVSVYFFDGI